MEKKKFLLGYYNYTVILTYLGLVLGFTGILCAINELFYESTICLMLAGLCDMFDGAVASTKKERTEQEKSFGIQIDSLSDLICFCVLPGIFLYKTNHGSLLSGAIGSLIALAGLIRLAYFNVSEADRQKIESTPRKFYEGLPVTSTALFVPFFYFIFRKITILLTPVIALISFLFVSKIKITKPHKKGKAILGSIGILQLIFMIFARMKGF